MTASVDSSLRYVLPADAVLLANLAALWAADPSLAEAIDAMGDESLYRVEAAKSGQPTVCVPSPDGRSLYLHSRHQPQEEAKRLIASSDIDGKLLICVHGLGLGYHLESIFEQVSEEAIIAVFEPDLRLLRTALEHRDLSAVIGSRRVLFFTREDKADLYARLTPHAPLLTVGFASINHPPSLQVQPAFHRQFQEWVGEFLSYSRTNLNTLVLNSQRTCQNISRNLAWYVAAPGLTRLAGRCRGRPAIVVSAGPSLRKNKHLLKDADGKAVIIAVQTTLKPLLEMGIEPTFVTSLDYHDISTRFFEQLPAGLRTELVAEPKATSAIFSLHPGPLSLLGNEYAEHLLREMKLDKPSLRSGATVAHLAYYLAEHLGCDPIIFVGQDLGFSDGLGYIPGTSYEDVWRPELSRFCTVEMKQWEYVVCERPILRRIADIHGRPMYTEERLFAYLQQFERDFAQARSRIIDATEGGAMKRGATVMTLADAIRQFCTTPLSDVGGDHPGLRWERLSEAARCVENRRAEAGQIEEITRQTLPLLREIVDHMDDQGRVNRAIARLDALRAKMNGLAECYDLVMQLTQRTELRRYKSDRQIAAARVEGLEKQRRQVQRDIDNVQGVLDASIEFQKLMDEVVASLKKMAAAQGKEAAA